MSARDVGHSTGSVASGRTVGAALRSNWLLLLTLGAGAAAVAARATWEYLPRAAGPCRAHVFLHVDGPGLATATLRSRQVLEAAVRQAGPSDAEAALRQLEHDLDADREGDHLLRLSLTGTDPGPSLALLRAVADAYRAAVDRERSDAEARLHALEREDQRLRQEQEQADGVGVEHAAAARAAAEAEQRCRQRLGGLDRELHQTEIGLLREHLRDTLQEREPTGPARDPVTEAALDEAVERDEQVRELVRRAVPLLDYIRRVEQIAVRPSALQEYRDAVSAYNALVRDKEERRTALRQRLEREHRERAQAEVETAREQLRRSVAQLAAEHRRLFNLVTLQRAELADQVEQHRQAEAEAAADRETLARRQEQRRELQTELAAARAALYALPRVHRLGGADRVERLPAAASAREGIAAALAGIAAFALVAGAVGWHGVRAERLRRAYLPVVVERSLAA